MNFDEKCLDSSSPFSTLSSTSFDSAIGDIFSMPLGRYIHIQKYVSIVIIFLVVDASEFNQGKVMLDSLMTDSPYNIPPSKPSPPQQVPPPPPPPAPLRHSSPGQWRPTQGARPRLSPARGYPRYDDVEQVCVSLMCQYQHCASMVPPSPQAHADSLVRATQLLSDSIARLRLFVFSLDTFNSLSPVDRATLYRFNVCNIQILKAAISVDLNRCQNAFPLPYGENLGETEAFHLIRAYELYNELRTLMNDIQALDIRELPVMLLIMMTSFFKPPPVSSPVKAPYLESPEKVDRIYHYYSDKLHAYLHLRLGPTGSWAAVNSISQVVDNVKLYSVKLKVSGGIMDHKYHYVICLLIRSFLMM